MVTRSPLLSPAVFRSFAMTARSHFSLVGTDQEPGTLVIEIRH